MHIVLIINDSEVVKTEVPDQYLADMDGYNAEENYLARKKILELHIEQFRKRHHRLITKAKRVRIELAFQSMMNMMEDAHIDCLFQIDDKNLIDL